VYGAPKLVCVHIDCFVFSVLSYLLTYFAHHVVKYRNSMSVDIVTLNYFPRLCDAVVLSKRMSTCADEVMSWMRANTSKTEVLWCSSGRVQYQIPTTSVRIGTTNMLPISSVRDLGVHTDSDVTTRTQVITTVRLCFSTLRELSSMRRCLSAHALLTLVRVLVVSKVDFCCSVLAGASAESSSWQVSVKSMSML